MKNIFYTLITTICFSGFAIAQKQGQTKTEKTLTVKNNFEEIFKSISPKEIDKNVFKLFSENHSVLTSGTENDYNSMTASWGGWGQLFEQSTAWNILGGKRYTLEYIKKNETYTVTFFEETYKDQVLFLGSKSGRNSNKMKEVKLTKIVTPSGLITYKEAMLILECKLVQVTPVKAEDFKTKYGKDFISKAFNDSGAYHNLIFGEITNVWVRK